MPAAATEASQHPTNTPDRPAPHHTPWLTAYEEHTLSAEALAAMVNLIRRTGHILTTTTRDDFALAPPGVGESRFPG